MQLSDVASQTSPPKGIQPQSLVTATEPYRESQKGNGLIPFLICSISCPNDIQEKGKHKWSTVEGDNKKIHLSQKEPLKLKKSC